MRVIFVLILTSLTLTSCKIKKEEKVKSTDSSPNSLEQKEESVIHTSSLKVQYSSNLKETRSLNLTDANTHELSTDYFITVPELSDVTDDYGKDTPNEEVERVSFVLNIPRLNDLRIYTMAKLEYKDGFKDLGSVLEEHESENGVEKLRVSIPNFHSKIRFIPNQEKVLKISVFFGSEEVKVLIPIRTASVISLKEKSMFDLDKMSRDDGENYPFKVVPIKSFKLTNPSNEVLSFVTETKVSGTLYRYIDEEVNKRGSCDFITSDRKSGARPSSVSFDHKKYKTPKLAHFVLGKWDEDREALIKKALNPKRNFIVSTLSEKEEEEYVLYMLLPKNSYDLNFGSCGAIRKKLITTSCRISTCESYACKWINGSGDDSGECTGGLGCDDNGCHWSWMPGCKTPEPHKEPKEPGGGKGGREFISALLNSEPRTCTKCIGGQHWEASDVAEVSEDATLTGFGVEITNPFKSTTIQTTKVPVRQTHQKAAKIMDIETNFTLTGVTDFNSTEELTHPESCKLECLKNPNDPGCF